MGFGSIKEKHWKELPIVSIDIETSGQYPFNAHICELAAVRTHGGKVVDTYTQLVKPPELMSDFVIGIHGISNEMVKDAPPIEEVILPFMDFIDGGICIGHHVPFDATFISTDCEKASIKILDRPLFCTSLLARNLIKGVPNHRLQTMVSHFGLSGGQAHRALDDSKACFEVFKKCMEQIENPTVFEIEKSQNFELKWSNFSFQLLSLKDPIWKKLLEATQLSKSIEFSYRGGSKKGQPRKAVLEGMVLNPTGSYIIADDGSPKSKRFYKDKITDLEVIWS